MRFLSRRDGRTQPGVLTPGYQEKEAPPRRGGREFSPKYASTDETTNGYLPPLQGGPPFRPYPGLKPRAESSSPFGTKITYWQRRDLISPVLHHFARPDSTTRTARPTKLVCLSLHPSKSRPRKRGTLQRSASEVGRTKPLFRAHFP